MNAYECWMVASRSFNLADICLCFCPFWYGRCKRSEIWHSPTTLQFLLSVHDWLETWGWGSYCLSPCYSNLLTESQRLYPPSSLTLKAYTVHAPHSQIQERRRHPVQGYIGTDITPIFSRCFSTDTGELHIWCLQATKLMHMIVFMTDGWLGRELINTHNVNEYWSVYTSCCERYYRFWPPQIRRFRFSYISVFDRSCNATHITGVKKLALCSTCSAQDCSTWWNSWMPR